VVNGDTIIVRAGTYVENIDFLGKAVTLMSQDGPEVTVIDGGQLKSVVSFENGEGTDSVLEGFTLFNGTGNPHGSGSPDYFGGGICCWGTANPTLIHNIVTGNAAADFGGGIFGGYNAALVIEYNTITQNSAKEGGGIFCLSDSLVIENNIIQANTASSGAGIYTNGSVTIRYNTITQNQAAYSGGGIYFGVGLKGTRKESSRYGLISQNLITLNTAKGGGGIKYFDAYPDTLDNLIEGNQATWGGGIYFDNWFGGSPRITGNRFLRNRATQDAGALLCEGTFTCTLNNNVFADNEANQDGGAILSSAVGSLDLVLANNTLHINTADRGGAIHADSGALTMGNTIFWHDHAATGKEIYMASGSTVNISYSDVDRGITSVYVSPGATLNWGAGMIDADPLLVDGLGDDFHLTHPSPCKDTGDNAALGLPPEDFEGDPRIADGTVDMGADEFYPHLYVTGDATPGGAIELKLTGAPGTSPVAYFIGTSVWNPPLPWWPYGFWYLKDNVIGPFMLPPIPSPGGVHLLAGNIPAFPPAPYTVYLHGLIGSTSTNLFTLEVE
jgi:hypothetical protein